MTEKRNTLDDYDYLGQSASVNEQTGLIPSAALTEEEKESYRMLYPYPPPLLKNEEEVQTAKAENKNNSSTQK